MFKKSLSHLQYYIVLLFHCIPLKRTYNPTDKETIEDFYGSTGVILWIHAKGTYNSGLKYL